MVLFLVCNTWEDIAEFVWYINSGYSNPRTKRVKMKILTLAPSKILNKMILEKIFEDKRHMSNSNFDVPQVEL